MFRWLRAPRERFWLMQTFLCAVFAGTLLLAVLVSRRMTRSDIRLERAAEFGPILVQRPAGWTERYTQDGVVFEEASPRGRPRRRLEIWTVFSPLFCSPLEFIARSDDPRMRDVAAPLARAKPEVLRGAAAPLVLGGWNGVIVSPSRLTGAARDNVVDGKEPWHASIACTLLPSGQVLLARLEGEALDDTEADRVLRRLGRTLWLVGQPYPAPHKELSLDDAITFTVPPPFATFPTAAAAAAAAAARDLDRQRDDMRISRLLIAHDTEHWMAADIVPCLTPPGARGGDALPSLMTLRDPTFRAGAIEQIDARTWLCRRDDERFPAMALRHDFGDGRGLLAEFRWMPTDNPAHDEERVREAWTQLANTLVVNKSNLVPQMIQRGREAAAHLPTDARLLLRGEPEETWRWYHETLPRESAVTFSFESDEQRIWGWWTSEHALPLGVGGREQGGFSMSRDWNQYRMVVSRDDPAALSQFSRLERGRMRTSIWSGWNAVAERESLIDASFVPGSVFMLALGRLPPEPVVIATDWLINPTGAASAEPLTLLLTPVFGRAQTGPAAETAQNRHAWRVRVNGRSFASEWALDERGRVDSVAFGGNVRLRRVKGDEGEGVEAVRAPPR